MPVYTYECSNKDCAYHFEEKRSIYVKGRKRCPKCRYKVEQIYSPASIHFKGEGWYVTDYKDKSGKPAKVASKARPNERKTSVKFVR